ncbi:hypothetical protein [Pedobacter frigoris]|uniref:Uncharacterized protein n=1 Tax=Pedobacter frigoris TaxID=2571272 RepID=A0A4U1CN98_9SPHI|nr:hypothetical protein [Pedobacter frigoris]TKC08964.1 hypothetical protein FA047_02390 [Pedobacter frigoris]
MEKNKETEPFNIRIGYGEKEVTLTILPTNEGYYKVIYFGGILGAVCFDGDDWDLVEPAEVVAGDLPFYEPELKGDRLEIVLNELTVDRIGREIDLYNDEDDDVY